MHLIKSHYNEEDITITFNLRSRQLNPITERRYADNSVCRAITRSGYFITFAQPWEDSHEFRSALDLSRCFWDGRGRDGAFLRLLPIPLRFWSILLLASVEGNAAHKEASKKLSGKNDGPLATVVRDQVRPLTDVHAHGAALSIISARERVRTPFQSCACALRRAREKKRVSEIGIAATARTKNGPCTAIYTSYEMSLIAQYHVRNIIIF